ncbi:thiolase family protein [Magnetospira sp. QH-2]|uniref:thiolase family protein n=1 Tax=Magnetospira sp. (strain QH-2) TaxID=1288970 RepID=UPI0003E819ED|nr:thiolase family protein [Magnetospira sp. QH-2]CCQ73247.1 Acetyl-CoA C-acyltransferase [Magnetospira sp. QH-2]
MIPIVIAGYLRTPFTVANRGALARVRPDDMAAQVIESLVRQTAIDPEEIEDLILGCAFPEGEQGLNLARMVGFLAGLPPTIAGVTVNRFCGSSMQAVHMAAGAMQLGAGEAYVCAGVESMTRVPIGGFNPMPHPGLHARMPQAYISMGETAENLARSHHIARADQESFALSSQAKAAAALAAGNFDGEIVPIKTPDGSMVTADGCPRPEGTAEDLAKLDPAFASDGTVTAGTSSPLTDGAAALLVTTLDYAERRGLTPLAKLRAIAVSGCAPEIMGIGPVGATRKALGRSQLNLGDIGVIELNEAFASQSLACIRDLGLTESRINLDGGALALGHPLGATGARIVGKAAQLLHRGEGSHALATQCIGGGQGIATILEAVP